ncbi:inositol-1-monophosphatase [Methylophaga lonarensis MPL]|uniref:Inositol-1-monophosphatase n=1 Tax=Methylophaga lonarensis MPL TaxID=1286106 RepID=M7PT84_9GAMM|nr:inositol monophosphatase [Methylophaga lonarensis]EMR13679.1 inositol-1-monophosphatase [Methylophaga lonarensis MPL]
MKLNRPWPGKFSEPCYFTDILEFMTIDLQQLTRLIREISREILLPRFNAVNRQYKADGSIVTIADRMMQDILTERLAEHYPDIKLLGEEMPASQQAELLSEGKPLWCLDPIDGTSNFASGMPCFSVSLALLQNNSVSHGLVYDPIRDECFTAQLGKGAWLNDRPLQTSHNKLDISQTLAMVDFKRLPPELSQRLITERPYGSQRSLGSIALELCWLAAGRCQLYLHGKQLLWDYAAAQLIISEAGGYITSLEGNSLSEPSLQSKSACAAVDAELLLQWRNFLSGHASR